jgi:hypothetical protein
MKKKIMAQLCALTLIVSTSFACDIEGKSGFAPENDLKISPWDKASNGMTEARFLKIIKSVSDVYAPIVASRGGTLKMNSDWNTSMVNARAVRKGNIWNVNMYGGLARHPLNTDDGFALVVCHELAHHLGGAPRIGGSWVANEGQADYFGAMKCFKRVFEKEDNMAIVSKMTVDAEATAKCEMVYKNADEVALCQRVAMAGKALGNILSSLSDKATVALGTPSKAVVSRTYDDHPAAQCRLDTYFQGALCDKSYDQDTSNNNPTIGTCVLRDGYIVGVRPLCWYKPGTDEI